MATNGDLNLFLERDRLKTFTNWSNTTVCPEDLSKAGFYCLQNQDKVKCPFCDIVVEEWVAGDDPANNHMKYSPNCAFVRSKLQQNTQQFAFDRAAPAAEGVCGKSEYCPNSSAETLPLSLLSRLDIEKVMQPAYHLFSTYDSRMNSFSEWPKSLRQKPNELAEAGFFYNGFGDRTTCFYCGGGLRDWEEDDNPWEEHALHFPQCDFVLLKKHPDFVKQVQANVADESVPTISFNNLTTKEEIGKSDDHRTHSHSSSSLSCAFVLSKLQQNTIQVALDRAAPADDGVCGKSEYCPNSSVETLLLSLLNRLDFEKVMESTYPLFSTYDSRVNSFSDWPKSLKQKPNELAEAGFFYNGVGDRTTCFYCGGGLHNWEEDDNPWEEHALHFPQCDFVLLKKHPDFVKQVQAKVADDKSVPSTSFNNLTTKEEIGETEDHCTHNHSSSSSSGISSDEGSFTPLCKICYKNEVNVVFLPCRHQFTCIDCALTLKNICPVCRRPFEGILEMLLS